LYIDNGISTWYTVYALLARRIEQLLESNSSAAQGLRGRQCHEVLSFSLPSPETESEKLMPPQAA
jgi:hypothetical protein